MVQSFERLAVVTFHLGTDSLRSRRTFVFNRMDDKWKIVHVHASDFVF